MARHSGKVERGMLSVALLLYASALAAVSLMPVSPDSALAATEARRTVNNLLHVPAYGLLAWLWVARFRAGSDRRSNRRRRRQQAGNGMPDQTVNCTMGAHIQAVGPPDPRLLAAGCIAAFAFGALMELAQRFVPGRKGALGDFLLNGAGVCAAAFLMWLYDRSRGQSLKSEDTPHASPGGHT